MHLLRLLFKLRIYEALHPTRSRLAKKYLSGRGIEIGALHRPLAVPKSAAVTYVDWASVDRLRAHYPELKGFRLAPVDIVDNGETLDAIQPASLDFLIANHFIEHCENPVKTLLTHLSRLKQGGILFMAVPDRLRTFDRAREATSRDHLIRDFREGPEWSRFSHYRDWVRFVEHVPEQQCIDRARALMETGYSIHFHVWSRDDFADMLEMIRERFNREFVVRESASCDDEFIVILQKSQPGTC